MDIQAIGSRYVDKARFSSPLTEAGGTGGFADVLEKARTDAVLNALPRTGSAEQKGEAEAKTTEMIPLSNRKPVIDRSGKLYEQCLALETFLTKTLISGMRSTVQKTGLIDDSFAGKMYEDMLYDEYAKTFTENANFGLAELAYLELTGQRGR
jgi:flagellar protein FlgJ